jgi:hypothetical protein
VRARQEGLVAIEGKNGPLTCRRKVRELDRRTRDGTDVRLLGHSPMDRVLVAVTDRHAGRQFEFEVDPADALAAFHHPYAYASDDHVAHASAA